MKQFISASTYFKSQFGQKVYKIALSAFCTCPNRDGSKSTGGCIFCSATGSGDFIFFDKDIKEQIRKAKELVNAKFPKVANKKYIAYFQNYTNTYGDAKRLESLYNQAIEDEEVVAISIATRPDCLPPEIMEVLKRLVKRTRVIIELGLQTSNEENARYINRAYPNCDYINAVARLHLECPTIHVITHVIFGLPKESLADMLSTISFSIRNKTDGLKISTLHVLKGTKLEEEYNKGLVPYLSEEAYFALLIEALKLIPESIVIHRLTGDGAKALLLSPLWTANKRQVLNALKKTLKDNEMELI